MTALPVLLATAVIPACAAPPSAAEGADEGGDPPRAAGGATTPGTPTSTTPTTTDAKPEGCPYDGFCVPEKIIKAKGVFLPKTCKSLANGEGRCMSIVLPELDKQKASLPVDVCDPNERCAPCFDPGSGAPTGACTSIECDAPKTQPVVFASCCKNAAGVSRGRCVPKATLPPEALSNLEKKECTDDALCAPAENFDPKYVPPKCSASSLLGKYDGVCFSTCVKQDFFAQLGTAQGNCATGSFCAPCKNPLTGGPTGAPGCAP